MRIGWIGLAASVFIVINDSHAQTPKCDAECPPSSCFMTIVRKVIQPSTETVKHTRICYDCKEYDYAKTRCAKTPIFTRECPDCEKHPPQAYPSPDCVKFGPIKTRRVLIKKIIPEDVVKPKAEVQCVTEVVPSPFPTCPPSHR